MINMGYVFKPSEVLDEIYDLMEEYAESSSEYNCAVIPIIEKFLDERKIEYTTEKVGDFVYGAYAISWVEDDEPVLLLFSYVE